MIGQLRVMGMQGDTKIIWDSEVPAEVEAAKKTFDELRAKHYSAYAVKKSGDKGNVIDKFDPDAEKIILAPQMSGG